MPMHANFADWYRSAAVTVPDGLLQKRWAGVEALAKKPSPHLVVGLATLFAVTPVSEVSVPEGFREAFREQDEAFPAKENLQELRVLAGATLRQIIEEEGRRSILASLALVCASFGPRRNALPAEEHVDAAETFLTKQASSLRQTSTPSSVVTPAMTKEHFAKIIPDAIFAQNTVANMKEHFTNAFIEIGTALSTTQKAVEALTHTVRVREEELNILWWLQNDFSIHLQKTFKEIGARAGALVFPAELSSLTTYIPGPATITAVLVRALELAGAQSTTEASTLVDAVNATPRQWREDITSDTPLTGTELLCPVLLGLNKSLTTEGANEWPPVYRMACDVPLDQSFMLTELAIQVYREHMLVALFSGTNK